VLRANSTSPLSHRSQFSKNDPRLSFCLSQCDPRIHFALVCGAKGCPSIRTYSAERIDQELDEATRTYFEGDDALRIEPEKKQIQLSRLLSWYGSDFGASVKERALWVARYVPADKAQAISKVLASKFKISFLPYDWSLNGPSPDHS